MQLDKIELIEVKDEEGKVIFRINSKGSIMCEKGYEFNVTSKWFDTPKITEEDKRNYNPDYRRRYVGNKTLPSRLLVGRYASSIN